MRIAAMGMSMENIVCTSCGMKYEEYYMEIQYLIKDKEWMYLYYLDQSTVISPELSKHWLRLS